jgi:hypothetical protein
MTPTEVEPFDRPDARLAMPDVRRIADDLANGHRPPLDVVGVMRSAEGGSYTEVLVRLRAASEAPAQPLVIGVPSARSPEHFRRLLADRLRQYFRDSPQ